MSAPNDSSVYLASHASSIPPVNVIQLMLVDELGHLDNILTYDSDGTQPARDLIPGGSGLRKQVYLIITRWTLGGSEAFGVKSRLIHRFSSTGAKYLKDFNDLQIQNVASMHEENSRRFWSLRFSLDSQLKNLIDEMRTAWFTTEDLDWIKGQDGAEVPNGDRPSILVLDRQLNLLPWEWIFWGQTDENVENSIPAVCRNFSVSLVIGHLKLIKTNVVTFNPDSTYYVVNPEDNLPHTESAFKSYFNQNFPQWTGIFGRMPQPHEVLQGFTQQDLFVYLGHGNGSRCVMSVFDSEHATKAVALIIGCSSGRPRLEGRFEAFASIFNHLTTGVPTAVSVLWDVTDKDIDRFTQKFMDHWILRKEESDAFPSSLTCNIFKAAKACKLQSLVAKSVIVYGIPAIPLRKQD